MGRLYWGACAIRCSSLAAGLEIYVDDEFRMGGEPGASAEDADVGARGAGQPPAWEHLGTFEQTRKENVQQPTAWAGAGPHASLLCPAQHFKQLHTTARDLPSAPGCICAAQRRADAQLKQKTALVAAPAPPPEGRHGE